MRIGINARALAKPDPAGVGNYTLRLLAALSRVSDDCEFVLFGVDSLPSELESHSAIEIAGHAPAEHSGLRAHLWEQCVLPWAVRGHDLDVLHTPAGFPPLAASVPLVTTVHDISPVTHPEWFSTGYAAIYRVLLPLTLRRSDEVIAISEFSRAEIRRRYPRSGDDASVVYNGLEHDPTGPRDPLEGLVDRDFLLFVGSINPRKNISRLLRAYRRVRETTPFDVPLVLAGSQRHVFADDDYPEVEGVVTPGYVSDAELRWLYDNATVFVYPSLYEGFGLPILEAMAWGVPVLTSETGATAEVAGDGALLVDPSDVGAIADGIRSLLADADRRAELTERGYERAGTFTWERTAAETLRIYEKALARYHGTGE